MNSFASLVGEGNPINYKKEVKYAIEVGHFKRGLTIFRLFFSRLLFFIFRNNFGVQIVSYF